MMVGDDKQKEMDKQKNGGWCQRDWQKEDEDKYDE